MNQNQINRKEMFDTTLSYLNANVDKISAIPKIMEFKAQFEAIVADIEEVAQKQSKSAVYLGKTKAEIKKQTATKADILNDSIEVLATLGGNDELAQLMNQSESSLYGMRNEDFIMRIKLIAEKAEENKDELISDYGVTEEQIADLQESFDQFLEISGEPRMYRVKSKASTIDLDELIKQATDVLLNRLDPTMKIFKNRDASFHNGYLAARVIVDN